MILTTIKSTLLAGLMAISFAPAAKADICRDLTHLGDSYSVCTIKDPTTLKLWLKDSSGTVIGEFFDLETTLATKGKTLTFAMNAGMYHADRRAVGLYISEFKQQTGIQTRQGPGNFGMLPNGVFCVEGPSASILESRRYKAKPPACRIATQSGPMLVINGALHPRFTATSTSKKRRNAVGVDTKGHTHFVVSNGFVRFHDIATLYRDVLDSPNALFLDGTISRLHAANLSRSDIGARMGPIIGQVIPAK